MRLAMPVKLVCACLGLVFLLFAPARADNRPFPAHATYAAGIIRPSHVSQAQMDQAVRQHYAAWKQAYLRNLGGEYWVKYDDSNSTVSEAHGYGMVLAAYMGDRAIFNSMFRYFRAHPSRLTPHLMAWKQTWKNGAMVNVSGPDSATDGDLDVAYALLAADAQWGSSGTIDYKREALLVLHDVLKKDVNAVAMTLKVGDWATGSDANLTRPSDFMAGHMLAFARADTANADKWIALHDKIAAIVNYQFTHGSEKTGLMPDFMVKQGGNFVPATGTVLEGKHDGDFSYNACRTPWRLSMPAITDGNPLMLAVLRRQANWIRLKTSGDPSRIKAGYYVRNGTNGEAFVRYSDIPFTAPFAVVAMLGGAKGQGWLNALWDSITGSDFGITTDYYGDSIRMQVLLTVSGNWWTL
jgi:endo-1,4-beta-D-glucanase Y